MKRCSWVNEKSEIYVKYHDTEWGVPKYDDKELFELLVLESFQAGLSWLTVLKKREAFRLAFDNFDVIKIANYDENKINTLLTNEKIIRSKNKILATINNAKIFIQIQKEFGSFSDYIWGFTEKNIIKNTTDKFVVNSPLSDNYETYKDDAVKASKILGITLTKSNGRKDDEGKPLAMAGFPYHALDTYLPKLIRAGERLAICDQLEMPKQTTSSKRGITEMVSPGKETGKQMAQESQETEQHTSLRR